MLPFMYYSLHEQKQRDFEPQLAKHRTPRPWQKEEYQPHMVPTEPHLQSMMSLDPPYDAWCMQDRNTAQVPSS
jgi:hypothetical protein